MISYNTFVNLKTLNRDEVIDFLNSKNLSSNKKYFKKLALEQVTYKDANLYNYKEVGHRKRPYMNIYAHQIKIPLYQSIKNHMLKDFISKFLCAFDIRFKYLLYIFKTIKEGDGVFVYILIFTRKCFLRKQKKLRVFNADYYQDSIKKCRSSKGKKNAVLLHKKHDPKLDENGKKQYDLYTISSKEEEIFKYISFEKFVNFIKKNLIYATSCFINKLVFQYKKIAKITIKNQDSIYTKRKKYIVNQFINRINFELNKSQEAMYLGYMDDDLMLKKFNKLIWKINRKINTALNTALKDKKGYYLGNCQSFTCLKDNIYDFENKLLEEISLFNNLFIYYVV